MPTVTDIYKNSNEGFVSFPHLPILRSSWALPTSGYIKINEDESFSAESHRSGIGIIFQDHSSNILPHFSKEITMDTTILIEIIAIKEGLLIAAASRWSLTSPFYLEIDSANIVSRFNDISQGSWTFRNIIWESGQLFGHHISWSISHIRRT